jgi:prepilin-type N-terminal cleavage/methylation domain-containing protein
MDSQRSGGAFSLIEIVVVIAVLAVFAALIYPQIAGNRRGPGGKAATPMAKAHDTVCQYNLQSVRQAIAAHGAVDTEEKFPVSIAELKLPSEVTHCDVSKEAYQYDPQTGTVRCPFPAHSSF